jgi:iron complex outermembrane receptor protein
MLSNNALRSAIAAVLGVFAAAAQAAPTSGLEEVVVTAQRRSEAIQDVPIAVTALSNTQLERLNVTNTLDLIKLIPNSFGSNNTGLGTANVYSIRGLNNTESIATFDPPVGTYVDDVFIARQNANNFAFFDVERVEVLRGPQGTLFGRNTTGGAVNVILKKPQPEYGGFAEVGFGQFNERMIRASADLPVSDHFLTKVSGYSIKDDGYVWNTVTGEKLNSNDNKGARVAVRWIPTDSFTWDVAADYVDQNYMNILNADANELNKTLPLNQRISGHDGRISTTGMRTDTPATRGIFVNDKQNYPLGNEVWSTSITSNIGWQTGIGTINFITGWRSMQQQFALDFFGIPPKTPVPTTGQFTIVNDGNHDQFTQEIKLNGDAMDKRLRYVAGVYYFDEKNKTDLGQLFAINGTFGCVPPTGSTVCHLPLFGGLTVFPAAGNGVTIFNSNYYDRTMRNTAKAWAGYVQADFDIVDSLTLTLGGRYTDEKKTIAYSPNDNVNAPPANQWSTADLKEAGIPTEQSTGQFTPRVALKWDVNSDLNFYASATNGFKSGGWNARNVNISEVQPFKPEKVWSYELGMRSEWFDHRLRANLTGFWSDVTDFQLPSAFVRPDGSGIAFITQNFADLEVKGAELELTWVPVAGLNLFLTAGVPDGKYQNVDPSIKAQQAACQAAIEAGNAAGISANCAKGIVGPDGKIADPVRLPDYTLTAGFSYAMPLGAGLELTPSAYVQDVGRYVVGTANEAIGISDGYTQVSAGISLGNPKDGWALSANCDNCSNEYIIASVLAGTQYYNNPRTWSVRFKYNW